MLEWAGGMDALAQQYARVGVEDSHGCNASWRIEGRGVGAESEASHLHGWSGCEESAAKMGAAAAAAVWIRARMIGCAAAWIGNLGQVSLSSTEIRRRGVRPWGWWSTAFCGCFDQGVIMGGYYWLLDGGGLEGKKIENTSAHLADFTVAYFSSHGMAWLISS